MASWDVGRLGRVLPNSAEIGGGALRIGGCALPDLAERFGTPLYVYDEETLHAQARRVQSALAFARARVSFAAKACSAIGVLRVFREEGLGLDTVSAGEIEAGLRAGFAPRDLHLHGNAKSAEELNRATELGLGAIVVDGLDELGRLQATAAAQDATVRVMVRVNVSRDVDTHPHLRTSGPTSKFGLSLEGFGAALDALAGSRRLRFVGIHAHPGSQIAEARVYRETLARLNDLARAATDRGPAVEEISIGGGWAVPYGADDPELTPEELARAIGPVVPDGVRLAVEPGRALVARAAIALYRVIAVKGTEGGKLVVVDGGMGDNPRPALYGTRYMALAVADVAPAGEGQDRVVGRYCEEGDVLADGVHLPVTLGDLVAIPVSGAYQLSMASGYNLVPPPAVVLVAGGTAQLIVRRATVGDLLARDV